jgi:hypothetical protein
VHCEWVVGKVNYCSLITYLAEVGVVRGFHKVESEVVDSYYIGDTGIGSHHRLEMSHRSFGFCQTQVIGYNRLYMDVARDFEV